MDLDDTSHVYRCEGQPPTVLVIDTSTISGPCLARTINYHTGYHTLACGLGHVPFDAVDGFDPNIFDPNIVVINIHLAEGTGYQMYCRIVAEQVADRRILLLAPEVVIREQVTPLRAFELGADGLVNFTTTPIHALCAAVQRLAAGQSLRNSCDLRQNLIGREVGAAEAGERRPGLDLLTKREREVFNLLLGNATNKEIAQRLVLSQRTVEGYARNVFNKLSLKNRRELIKQFYNDPVRYTTLV